MAYDVNSFVKLGELKTLVQRTATEIAKASSSADDSLKFVKVEGNTVKFFKTADGSGTAAQEVDFPKEIFLDGAKTKFESKFKFLAATYPGATNPSLDDKPVFVLAVKSTTDTTSGTAEDTVTYSFIDMSTLVDTYTVKEGISQKILEITGYEVEVKISAAANNALKVKDDGLHVDISDKADKVANATANNFAALDENGNLKDSGIRVATAAEVTEMMNEVFETSTSGGDSGEGNS